jgi:hypothetical protein
MTGALPPGVEGQADGLAVDLRLRGWVGIGHALASSS